MKLTVPATLMTGIDGGTWSFVSHIDCTFGFDKSNFLFINETDIQMQDLK